MNLKREYLKEELKSVHDLYGYNFYFTLGAIEQLWWGWKLEEGLHQLHEEITSQSNKPDYYFGEVVLKYNGQGWDVVNGHRSILCLYIVNRYIHQYVHESPYNIFNLFIKRTENCNDFFDIDNRDDIHINKDYIIFSIAFRNVKEWFKNNVFIYNDNNMNLEEFYKLFEKHVKVSLIYLENN